MGHTYRGGKSGCKMVTLFDSYSYDGVSAGIWVIHTYIHTCLLVQVWINSSPSLPNHCLWYGKLWGPSQRVVTLFYMCLCISALLPSYLFLADVNSRALLLRTWKIVAFCRFLPKLQPVWVVGGQLSNWPASLTSSVINRAKSGRFFFVHLQALMQHRESAL